MARKCLYLSDDETQLLERLSDERRMKPSRYIGMLLREAESNRQEKIDALAEQLAQLIRSEHANGKLADAMMDMMNTYFKMFASGDANEKAFFEVKDAPHPWTTKALEAAEARIRMARYNKRPDNA